MDISRKNIRERGIHSLLFKWMDGCSALPSEHSTASRWLVGLLAVLALALGGLMQMGTINIQQVTKSSGWSDAQKQSAFIHSRSLFPAFLSKKGNIPAQWYHIAVCISLPPFHLISFMHCGLVGVGKHSSRPRGETCCHSEQRRLRSNRSKHRLV